MTEFLFQFAQGQYASTFYTRLAEEIQDAISQIGDDKNLTLYFLSNAGHQIRVVSIGYSNPSILIIQGADDAGRIHRVFTHVNSVQMMMVIENKAKDEPPKRREIGFVGDVSRKGEHAATEK